MPHIPQRHRQVLVVAKLRRMKTAGLKRRDERVNFVIGLVIDFHDQSSRRKAGKMSALPGERGRPRSRFAFQKINEADRLTIRLTCRDFELLLLAGLVDPDRQARLMARGGVAM